jgi:two-component sensor histidine kinase
MTRTGWVSSVLFGGAVVALVATFVLLDRAATLQAAEDRTRSIARMVAAHADAAIGDAATIIGAVDDAIAAWDFIDPSRGRALFEELRTLTNNSPHVRSAWVTDAKGVIRLDTGSFPASGVDAHAQPYFSAHLTGVAGPIITTEPRSDQSRNSRITYSRAVHTQDGALHALVVVGLYTQQFRSLYEEIETWPQARLALYTKDGHVLAQREAQVPVTPDYLAALLRISSSAPYGSAILDDGGRPRLVSWYRVAAGPGLLATSSQSVEAALSEWRWRSSVLSGVAATAILGFVLLLRMEGKAQAARETAEFYKAGVQEVHHRVKNALQLVISMIHMRSRDCESPEAKAELAKLAGQLSSIAEIQNLLQHGTQLDVIDVCQLLQHLCAELQAVHGNRISFECDLGDCSVPTSKGTSVGIIANELLTNAIKYSQSDIAVSLQNEGTDVALVISDNGGGLPADFDVSAQKGFGLRTMQMIAQSIGGKIVVGTPAGNGASIRLVFPKTDRAPHGLQLT